MSKVPPVATDAIRERRPVPDAKLAAPSRFAATMLAARGRPNRQDVETFLAAG